MRMLPKQWPYLYGNGKPSATMVLIIMFLLSCERPAVDVLHLKEKLNGHWRAKAFNGELLEVWSLGRNGFMQQDGYYVENGDTTYRAVTRIEKVDGDIILFSVIKDSTPKIFKATLANSREILFENKDYRNPYAVRYEFLDDGNYRRTITGVENDSVVSYIFDFRRDQDLSIIR